MPIITPPEPLVHAVADLPTVMGLSASTIDKLLKSGELPSRKAGRRTLVLRSDVAAYLLALPYRVEPVNLPVDASLPSVADDPSRPSPLDRILDAEMHRELAARRAGRDPQVELDALMMKPRGAANTNIPEPGEDI